MSDVTHDDTVIVTQIIRSANNYYSVLSVTRTANEAQIKMAYKKLAIRCHPDKNKHPKAAEAFKIVNTANTVLSDPEKRRVYDEHGAEGLQRQESTGSPHAQAAARRGRGGGEFFSPEDFFGFPRGAYRRQQPHPNNMQHVEIDLSGMMPIFMILLIFVAMLMGTTMLESAGSSRSGANRGQQLRTLFSLTENRQSGYIIERSTSYMSNEGIKATYYVRGNFGDTIRRNDINIREIEVDVLKAQREYLERRCYSEMVKRKNKGRASEDQPQVCRDYEHIRKYI